MGINPIKHSSQAIDNWSFDETYQTRVELPVETDGVNLLRKITNQSAKKITVSGSIVFIGTAPCGSAESDPVWQCKKIMTVGASTTITWADGNSNFDNSATDLTSLNYI